NLDLVYSDSAFVARHAELIKKLTRLKSVNENDSEAGLKLTQTSHNIRLAVDKEQVKAFADELEGNIKAQEQVVTNLQKRLGNKSYAANAPKKIVDETKAQLEEAESVLETMQTELK